MQHSQLVDKSDNREGWRSGLYETSIAMEKEERLNRIHQSRITHSLWKDCKVLE